MNIPAEGKDYFPTPNLRLDLPEDRWIRALEIQPSNREVTHHSGIFTAGGAGGGLAGAQDSSTWLTGNCYLADPGQPPTIGLTIFAGSALGFGRNFCERSLATSVTYKLRSWSTLI